VREVWQYSLVESSEFLTFDVKWIPTFRRRDARTPGDIQCSLHILLPYFSHVFRLHGDDSSTKTVSVGEGRRSTFPERTLSRSAFGHRFETPVESMWVSIHSNFILLIIWAKKTGLFKIIGRFCTVTCSIVPILMFSQTRGLESERNAVLPKTFITLSVLTLRAPECRPRIVEGHVCNER
jgi:hypothetical protein